MWNESTGGFPEELNVEDAATGVHVSPTGRQVPASGEYAAPARVLAQGLISSRTTPASALPANDPVGDGSELVDAGDTAAEEALLVGQLATDSTRLVHDLNNGLTRALGRCNLLMKAVREGTAVEQDVAALQQVHRELVALSRGLMTEVVVPTRAYVQARRRPIR